MKDEVRKSKFLRVLDSVVDMHFEMDTKKIWIPQGQGGGFQFNLEDSTLYEAGHGRPIVGWVKIDTEKQFNEFFNALKSLSSFESVEDFNARLQSLEPKVNLEEKT